MEGAYYTITFPIQQKDVEIIKRDFDKFMDEAGGCNITIKGTDDSQISPELHEAIKFLFLGILYGIRNGKFKDVH